MNTETGKEIPFSFGVGQNAGPRQHRRYNTRLICEKMAFEVSSIVQGTNWMVFNRIYMWRVFWVSTLQIFENMIGRAERIVLYPRHEILIILMEVTQDSRQCRKGCAISNLKWNVNIFQKCKYFPEIPIKANENLWRHMKGFRLMIF